MLSTLECYFVFKVTKLDRDPASGTALQEISFWLNLERALYRIQEKRESPEVLLTLDILKHGKRFHATVSFDTDTGKDESLELRGWCSELSAWVCDEKEEMHRLSWLLTPLHLTSSFASSRWWKWSSHLPPFPFRAFKSRSQSLGLRIGSPGGSPPISQLPGSLNRLCFFQCKVKRAFDSLGRSVVYVKQKFFPTGLWKESWSVLSLLLFTCPPPPTFSTLFPVLNRCQDEGGFWMHTREGAVKWADARHTGVECRPWPDRAVHQRHVRTSYRDSSCRRVLFLPLRKGCVPAF